MSLGGSNAGVWMPESITICARCAYGAWRDHYPCNRCGGLEPRRYVPVDAVVEALRAEGQRLGDLTWNPEEPAALIEREFGPEAQR